MNKIVLAKSNVEIERYFPVMLELRPHLNERDFLRK